MCFCLFVVFLCCLFFLSFFLFLFLIELPVKGTVWFGNASVLFFGLVCFLKPIADVCCWLVVFFFFSPPVFSLLKSPLVVPERGATLLFFCAEPLL